MGGHHHYRFELHFAYGVLPLNPASMPSHCSSFESKLKNLCTLQEMFAYFVFLILFTAWVSSSRDLQYSFAFGSLVRERLLHSEFQPMDTRIARTFYKVSSLADVHNFLHGPFLETLWGGQIGNDGEVLHDPKDWGWVLGQSRLIGAPRLRQVRTVRWCRMRQ